MIPIQCKCGEKTEVPLEMAGEAVQCTRCGLLVDIPQLSDLNAIENDGTLRMSDVPVDASRLKSDLRAYGKQTDLRHNLDEYLNIGLDLKAEESTPEVRKRKRPRYDPLTGQLIKEIELVNDVTKDAPQDIPMAKANLSYASVKIAGGSENSLGFWQAPYKLFCSANLFAMLFVWVAHIAFHLALFNWLTVLASLFIMLTIIAHYANVIEEYGPNQREEVPALLRSASISMDVIEPLKNLFIAALITFCWPVLFEKFMPIFPHKELFLGLLEWASLVVFPAYAFTAITSGAVNNLLPARALSVCFVAPLKYTCSVLAMLAGFAFYRAAVFAMSSANISDFFMQYSKGSSFKFAIAVSLVWVLFAGAVYFFHLSAVWLGVIYRDHHEQLSWILQKHFRIQRTDVMGQLKQMRASGDKRVLPGANRSKNADMIAQDVPVRK